MEGFRAIFLGVDDPRKSNATKHGLIEMLAVALLATLSGSSSCAGFARYTECKQEFLREFMELKGGPECHDAFSDLSDALNPKQLAAAMTKFANALFAALPSDQVAIDGKVLRGTILDALKRSALHLVQAVEPGSGLVLGQIVNAKVKFPRSAKVKFPSFWCFGGEPAQSSVRVSFLGRPRFFGGGGGVIGAFVRTCSGMRSACFLSR